MSAGERVGRYGAHIVVTVTVVSQAVSTAVHGSQLVAALYAAVIAGGVWAWYGHRTHDRGVWAGSMAQTMTWDCYVRPHTPPKDDALYTVLAQRMRQTDQYVRAFAAEHGLERISIALPLERGAFGEACSTRHGQHGHVWLGTRWFHPRDTRHLPAVLEHELAHVLRSDPRKHLIAETTAVATTAFAAGTLPLPAFALTALTAWLAIGAFRWWSELASDAHALRTCGRALLVSMWSADLAEARTMPRALRFWHTLCALRMHPPLHLRRWFARRAPLSLPASGHPLTTTPGITPVRSAPGE